MNWKLVTGIVVTVTAVLLATYAIFMVAAHPEATISEMVQTLAFQYPILPFAAGVLCGHFFFPVRR